MPDSSNIIYSNNRHFLRNSVIFLKLCIKMRIHTIFDWPRMNAGRKIDHSVFIDELSDPLEQQLHRGPSGPAVLYDDDERSGRRMSDMTDTREQFSLYH